jgi:putative PEP-CTERM system TPR-repeat lipoprotein
MSSSFARKSLTAFAAAVVFIVGCSDDGAKFRHFAAGENFVRAGKLREAIVEFRNAVQRDDKWGEARFALAEAYALNGDLEGAYGEYVRAADLMPDHTPAQLKAATYLMLVGQYVDARSRVEEVLKKDPNNVDAQIIRGNVLAGLKDIDGAVDQIAEAIKLEPSRSQTYTNLALFKAAQGERDEARAAFEKAVQTDAKSIAAWLALANFQWSGGEIAAAEHSLKRAYDLDTGHIVTNRALATFYISTLRPSLAEPYLKTVVERAGTAGSKLRLADYYVAGNRPDDARRVLEPLKADMYAAAAAEIRLAGIAYTAGQTVDAHRMLRQLIEREPNNGDARRVRARWYLVEDKREQALNEARLASNIDPRSIEAHYIRGLAESRTRRTTDAIKSFGDVLRLNPRAAAAQVELSRLNLARNAVDSAVLYAEEALRNAPDSLDARLALARAWLARDETQRVAIALEQLRKLAPSSAAVHALTGSMHMLGGDRAAARAAFDRALHNDPGLMEALVGLTTLDMLQNNAPAARVRIESRLEADSNNPDLLMLAARCMRPNATCRRRRNCCAAPSSSIRSTRRTSRCSGGCWWSRRSWMRRRRSSAPSPGANRRTSRRR